MSKDMRALQKLRREVEKTKRALSSSHQAQVEIEALFDGVDFSETLTRAKFEELNSDLFKNTMGPVNKVLNDSGLKKEQIDEIVLVGGSTRIPKIQQLIKDLFKGKEPNRGINPDEAVAYGAAVQGGIMSGEGAQELLLLDVTPLSLGIEVEDGAMDIIIPRNTVIPTKKMQEYTSTEDNQMSMDIPIYEGERPRIKDNHLLGKFEMGGIPPAKAGDPNIQVTFQIDANGILKVKAEDQATSRTKSITISNDKGRLTAEQIEKMVKEAEKFAEQDAKTKASMDARHALEDYLRSMRKSMDGKGFGGKLDGEDKEKINEALKDGRTWIDANPDAGPEEIKEKQTEVEAICSPIISSYYGDSGGGGDSERDTSEDGNSGEEEADSNEL